LAGCDIPVQPFTDAENTARVEQDLERLFADQERIDGPIMLEEAIARALSYNLDHRLKLMERAVGVKELEVARLSLLPNVAANAGYNMRSHADTTFNEAKTSTSTTSDKQTETADLTVSWNVLDFGIGYIRAKQQADLAMIVEERRRQVLHNILQETRAAYWRAVAAERALRGFGRLEAQVRTALEDSEAQVQAQVNQLDAMIYQRTLLETLRQLESLRRDMEAARAELAALMNVHPDSEFTLADAEGPLPDDVTAVAFDGAALELAALKNRSELRSEAYQLRINQEEARVALLQMIPGLNFSAGINYTSDSFKANQRWYDGSMALAWNVMQIFQGPKNIELAETRQELSEVRRLALSMAVIAQVNVAQIRFAAAKRDFELADRIAAIESDISRQVANARAAQQGSELDEIEAEVRLYLADLRRNMAYAEMQAAFGRLVASTGADPDLGGVERDAQIPVLAGAVARALEAWEQGSIGDDAAWDGQAKAAPPTNADPARSAAEAAPVSAAPEAAVANPEPVTAAAPAPAPPPAPVPAPEPVLPTVTPAPAASGPPAGAPVAHAPGSDAYADTLFDTGFDVEPMSFRGAAEPAGASPS
jgi:outer membrane protein TolC